MCPKNNDEEEIKLYPTIEEFELNLPNTVKILKTDEKDKLYIIGTAHFSKKSQTDVSFVMRNVKPDGVVLELCPLRLHILKFDEETLLREAQDLNISKIREIFKEHGVMTGMFYLSFLRTNAKITKQLSMAPGGECRRAVKEAGLLQGCKIFLGDRPLNITIQRATAGLTFKQKIFMSQSMHADSSQKWKITEEEIEKFKQNSSEMLDQMKLDSPSIYKAFVSERDYILAHSMKIAIDRCKQTHNRSVAIVGVIGMGHLNGVIDNFGKTNDNAIRKLMQMSPSTKNGNGGSFFNSNTTLISSWNNSISSRLKYLFYLRKYWGKFKR